MNLPRGYKPRNFVADPAGRANHLHHPKTDEVFHVDADTYNAIVKRNQPEPEIDDADDLERTEVETDAETGMTLSVDGADENEDAEGSDETGTPLAHDLAELKSMAESLGLELAEDATPEDIQAAVHAAVGGAK